LAIGHSRHGSTTEQEADQAGCPEGRGCRRSTDGHKRLDLALLHLFARSGFGLGRVALGIGRRLLGRVIPAVAAVLQIGWRDQEERADLRVVEVALLDLEDATTFDVDPVGALTRGQVAVFV
jgi:hypothetical protein